jgi:hypothetical protein
MVEGSWDIEAGLGGIAKASVAESKEIEMVLVCPACRPNSPGSAGFPFTGQSAGGSVPLNVGFPSGFCAWIVCSGRPGPGDQPENPQLPRVAEHPGRATHGQGRLLWTSEQKRQWSATALLETELRLHWMKGFRALPALQSTLQGEW